MSHAVDINSKDRVGLRGSRGAGTGAEAQRALARTGLWIGRRWWAALGVIALIGLAIRIIYVIGWQDPSALPVDAAYYHYGANDLANGLGFDDPLARQLGATTKPGTGHPPGYVVVLAVPSLLGLQSTLSHQLWSCLLGTMTIVVIALVGRQLLGDRVGLIAGGLAALYPGLWSNDAYLQSETLTQLLCALALLFAYQALRRPSTRTAGLLGVICGAAALTRGETILLLPLLVVPALLLAPGSWKRRGGHVVVATVVMSLVIAPWAIYNSTRLHRPEPISSLLGPLLLGSNCPATYYGPGIGGFGFLCAIPPPKNPRLVDVSDVDYRGRRLAVTFVRDHASRLPVVVAARVGRTFGFFHPLASHEGDVRRERPLALVMLLMYYALAVAGVAGAVVLRRAGRPIWPLVSLVALSLVVTVTSYGNVRFRAAGDVGLVVLAAVAAAHGYDRIAHRDRDGEQPPVIA